MVGRHKTAICSKPTHWTLPHHCMKLTSNRYKLRDMMLQHLSRCMTDMGSCHRQRQIRHMLGKLTEHFWISDKLIASAWNRWTDVVCNLPLYSRCKLSQLHMICNLPLYSRCKLSHLRMMFNLCRYSRCKLFQHLLAEHLGMYEVMMTWRLTLLIG